MNGQNRGEVKLCSFLSSLLQHYRPRRNKKWYLLEHNIKVQFQTNSKQISIHAFKHCGTLIILSVSPISETVIFSSQEMVYIKLIKLGTSCHLLFKLNFTLQKDNGIKKIRIMTTKSSHCVSQLESQTHLHCQNTVQEWRPVRILSACGKTLKKQEYCDLSFFKKFSWNVLLGTFHVQWIGVSLSVIIHFNWLLLLVYIFLGSTCFCPMQLVLQECLALIIVHYTHMTPVNPQSINCLMPQVKVAIA